MNDTAIPLARVAWLPKLLIGCALLVALPALAPAQIISLNFRSVAFTSDEDLIGSTEFAGAGTAYIDGWNNYLNDAVSNPSGTNLSDNSGLATTMDFAFTTQTGAKSSRASSTVTPSDGTEKLLIGGRSMSNSSGHPANITLSEIPYDTYNIYIYFNAAFGDRLTGLTVDGTTYYTQSTTGGILDDYVLTTSTTPGVYTQSNYALFTGITGETKTITMLAQTGNNGSLFISGFQVQAIPEPTAGLMLSLAGLAWAIRRRGRYARSV